MRTNFENLVVYQLSEKLADTIWEIVASWDSFAKDTVAKQIVKSADSIGANIAEGSGRGSYQDNRRFAKIARGSLFETKHWLRRAYKRKLLDENQTNELKVILDELTPKLSAYINSIGRKKNHQRTTNNGQLTTNNEQPATNIFFLSKENPCRKSL